MISETADVIDNNDDHLSSFHEQEHKKQKRKSESVQGLPKMPKLDSNGTVGIVDKDINGWSDDGLVQSGHSDTVQKNGCDNCEDIDEQEDRNGSESMEVNGGTSLKPKTVLSVVKPPKRCDQCKQFLDDSDLRMFLGDSDEALEEFAVLADERLSVFTGEEESIEMEEVIQHKITNFTVYDKHLHLCPFDSGLVEKNVDLYISGSVKPIYDDNPTAEDGIPASKLGPIGEWWITGYDGGDKALLGVSTGFAEYILMNPSEEYRCIMQRVYEKMSLSKIVIEFLAASDDETSYEDLLHEIQTAVPPLGLDCTSFTEDMLLSHAQFLVEQVESYDFAADDDEDRLLIRPCLRDLLKRSGAVVGKQSKFSRKRVHQQVVRKRAKQSMATTTPLVRNIFDTFFTGQIDSKAGGPRRRRCGVCEACQLPDCGQCSACRNMAKFGGSGTAKQACLKRRCPNLALREAEENQIDQDDEISSMNDVEMDIQDMSPRKRVKARQRSMSSIQWIGEPCKQDNRSYYKQVKIGNETISVGDTVSVQSEDDRLPIFIIQIQYMYEDKERKKEFHGSWFSRGSDTILGETSDSNELFLIDLCDTNPLTSIISRVNVVYQLPPSDWATRGGVEEPKDETKEDTTDFFYQKWYHPEFARFEDPPLEYISQHFGIDYCPSCVRLLRRVKNSTPILGDPLSSDDNEKTLYQSFQLNGETFKIGDCAYLSPDAFKFKAKQSFAKKLQKREGTTDENRYPELYRKTSDYVKGSNDGSPDPFLIGKIFEIYVTESNKDEIKLKVNKFYRPENTHLGIAASYHSDFNALYWSEEVANVTADDVQGKCFVVYHDLRTNSVDTATLPSHTFYFSEAYVSHNGTFSIPPPHILSLYNKRKKKGKLPKSSEVPQATDEPTNALPVVHNLCRNRLRSFDVFAGCGGLSEGFHKCGLSETHWAVEIDEPAAQAFRLNNPKTTVFVEDCNDLLNLVMEGKDVNGKGQRLPKKGEVDMLCGGPPCQGFSGMNRFNSREYSQFKNSLVVSFLSYCDYYRPRYFVLENVRNFVSFKRSMVLKLTLRCLTRIGYQCTIAVLQAGSYGIPQSRRRAILLAAAPGERLPFYPEPTHVFSPKGCQLSIVVDNDKHFSNISWLSSCPYRAVTVRDAMSDLPKIRNGAAQRQISYDGEPQSAFQRMVRDDQEVLLDHVCKEMAPLSLARIRNIPCYPGADWRDLPNIELKLPDGNLAKKLKYTHHDTRNCRSSDGQLRGVCSCASGKPCDPADRQFSTLIPWCLPHTSNRHNQWAGLYGRLAWDGYFGTTVTNPEPMGKQGRILHPDQHRVVSVRECARSQGFPDSYKFFGTLLDRHKQVGNAVPPPLAFAIGSEILKAIQKHWEWEDMEE
ncbi:DNA (cytosine-5)-methyltransferase 1-like [Corticium candelabrum]|uniref:DNA (cytosine-5)-methyltransferase 1-like n=1 Tax=Corticium candelabrum TaxID=121492 RepID=UPI002E26CE12|nr:DNA (cytosine-5)-methyltransferase 1-like [Corticium candelabrum]